MAEVAEPYLREQLEKRRNELKSAISSPAPAMPVAPLLDLLSEVDSAMQRMEQGTYGICEVCHDPVEKDRLLADPLTRLCIDHLTHEEQRALERDVELASSIQRGLLPQSDVRFRDWQIHYLYNPAGIVSGDYCDVILPATNDGKLFFLVGDVAGKGIGASLLMTHLHAMFRSLSGGGHDLEKLLEIANSVFCESTTASQYATLICGRAGRSGELEIVNAGHLPALVITKEGVEQFGSTGFRSDCSRQAATLSPTCASNRAIASSSIQTESRKLAVRQTRNTVRKDWPESLGRGTVGRRMRLPRRAFRMSKTTPRTRGKRTIKLSWSFIGQTWPDPH